MENIDGKKILTVDELRSNLQNFGFLDFVFFFSILLASSGIGAYFGFFKKKEINSEKNCETAAEDYLMGGRTMKVLPVSLSLIASCISGLSFLGHATESYVYGIKLIFQLLMIIVSAILAWIAFLPIYCDLRLTSIFEYLEMRFDKRIRTLGSVINIIGLSLWLPLVIYVPGLVFNQVSGINVHVVTPIISSICIFYTCVGGLKAVIWTDVLQSGIMVGTILLIAIKGTIEVGGFGELFRRNYETSRIELPDMTLDPTVRISVLAVFIGGSISWMDLTCCGQMMMQRYLAVKNIRAARKVLTIFVIGAIFLIGGCIFNGLIIYAYYHDCDPLTTKLAKVRDQLLPLLFMDMLGDIPGLPGFFVAGIFSAALSSLSSGLNSLSAVILEDFVKQFGGKNLSERKIGFIMRTTVVIFGFLIFGMVFLIQHLGMILQLAQTLNSVTAGPMLSLFVMGVFLPWINGKSALTGGTVALLTMACICVYRQFAIQNGQLIYPEKPTSINGCEYSFDNSSIFIPPNTQASTTYHVTFLWFSTLGLLISVVFANLASLIFGIIKPENVNIRLIAPFLRKYYVKNKKPEHIAEMKCLMK